MATFFVDLLMVSLMVHSRFLAMKKRVAVDTNRQCQHTRNDLCSGPWICLLPIKMTATTTTMMATRAPVERVMELAELSPAAPASVPSGAVMLPDWPCHESSVARGKYADVCDMMICLDWFWCLYSNAYVPSISLHSREARPRGLNIVRDISR